MRKNIFLILVLAMLMVLGGCASAEKESMPSAELQITATDIAYSTQTLSVKAGQKVKLTLDNQGALEHDFIIQSLPHEGKIVVETPAQEMSMSHENRHGAMVDFDLHLGAPPKGTSTVIFTPNKSGEYEFFCSVEGHQAAGMVGKLIVTE